MIDEVLSILGGIQEPRHARNCLRSNPVYLECHMTFRWEQVNVLEDRSGSSKESHKESNW